jgi:hypothetical protein
MRPAQFLLAAALVFALPVTTGPQAADLVVQEPATNSANAEISFSTRDYLERKADLLLIRATFDVLGRDEIIEELALDHTRIGENGASAGESRELSRRLLAEGSYMIVALEYIVRVGGAYFPDDRPSESYAGDAMVKLDTLHRVLMRALDAGTDPLPVLESINEVLALTEGFGEVPPRLDHFGERDALVAAALAHAQGD